MPDLLELGRPSKIIGIGSNYRKHALEMGRPLPKVPKMFLIAPSALVGPGEYIELPPESERVDHEAELCVVIGERARRVSESAALSHVYGYTCANDVTARDLQRLDKVFARAKGFDTFCPVGPTIVRDLDPRDLRVQCRIDGELRQDGRTSDMVFGVAELISFVSHVMTLEPGDLICTGTPAGVGALSAGMTVEVEIEGIGVLSNPVRLRAD
ncbi:MAG: fumarylacetoacetate hydrolase family protein [Proteobacteria bacterium]|nr:fumarylacetoacetate hydrolase family protein [Pseudomonadota bacterium]MCP4917020.1 fumarylacetoacetate hydrolase family protein [Pseudomonadota bacterium]